MKILLLANQPEKTTRLQMFRGTLEELGYEVVVPTFNTINWEKISRQAAKVVKRERPTVVHVFNVPDVIYRNLPKLKGMYFDNLIYDYRSPWGVELQESFGVAGKVLGEHFEKGLALSSDAITTVNTPLGDKVRSYLSSEEKNINIIPNYPSRSFNQGEYDNGRDDNGPIIFVGRVWKMEGIDRLVSVAKKLPEEEFWIIGDGPFSRWYLFRKPENVKLFGWQPHEEVARLVNKAKLCLIPRKENLLTPYATDKSVWKLNEYLNLGKLVIASGITKEEDRKNLVVVKSSQLDEVIKEHLQVRPDKLREEDYRFWDRNRRIIRDLYDIFT